MPGVELRAHALGAPARADADLGEGIEHDLELPAHVAARARLAAAAAEHDALVAGVALHPNEAPRLAAAGELDAALALPVHPLGHLTLLATEVLSNSAIAVLVTKS